MKRESASGSLEKKLYISSSHPSDFLMYSADNLHKCGHSLLSPNPICLAACMNLSCIYACITTTPHAYSTKKEEEEEE